jgi:hypothetical protein
MPIYIIRKMIYIIWYKNTSAEVLLNKMWERVECLLERMVFPQYHEGPPARSNKHFYLIKSWSGIST